MLFQSDYRLRAHQAPCFARAARYASVLISSDIPMGADDDALTGLIGAGALLILLLLRAAPGAMLQSCRLLWRQRWATWH